MWKSIETQSKNERKNKNTKFQKKIKKKSRHIFSPFQTALIVQNIQPEEI